MTLLLKDYSGEIPPFLQRNDDGSLKYPNMPVGLIAQYEPITTAPDPVAERLAAAAARDRRAAEAIRRAAEEEERARSKQHSMEAAEKRKLDKQRKAEILKAQRRNFYQHFRWGFDL